MPKHGRSEYMKGVLFAEEQKEIGWVFKGGNYEEQSLEWECVIVDDFDYAQWFTKEEVERFFGYE